MAYMNMHTGECHDDGFDRLFIVIILLIGGIAGLVGYYADQILPALEKLAAYIALMH